MSILWSTVSNTALKSRRIKAVFFPLSRDVSISLLIRRRAVSVPWYCLYAGLIWIWQGEGSSMIWNPVWYNSFDCFSEKFEIWNGSIVLKISLSKVGFLMSGRTYAVSGYVGKFQTVMICSQYLLYMVLKHQYYPWSVMLVTKGIGIVTCLLPTCLTSYCYFYFANFSLYRRQLLWNGSWRLRFTGSAQFTCNINNKYVFRRSRGDGGYIPSNIWQGGMAYVIIPQCCEK